MIETPAEVLGRIDLPARWGDGGAGRAREPLNRARFPQLGQSGCWIRWFTGSLWFLIGFHMLRDYTEGIVFSIPDSSLLSVGRLLVATIVGQWYLTGGSVGPEASPAAVVVDVFVLIAVTVAFRRKGFGVGMLL